MKQKQMKQNDNKAQLDQTPKICTYGYSHFRHFKTVATEVEIQFLCT